MGSCLNSEPRVKCRLCGQLLISMPPRSRGDPRVAAHSDPEPYYGRQTAVPPTPTDARLTVDSSDASKQLFHGREHDLPRSRLGTVALRVDKGFTMA